MIWVCACLALALTLIVLRYAQLKRTLRQLVVQMEALTRGDTEKSLDLTLMDRDLEKLASLFNRMAERQRQAASASRRREEALQENVADISHDLRTPLTVILGHLQLLAAEPLNAREARRVAIVRGKAEAMKDLVDAFYELSLLESERRQPEYTRFNLTNLLLDLLAEQAPAFEARGLVMQVILPECAIFVDSDRSMLERILQNLLTNTVRYAVGSARICLEQTEETVLFSVTNSVEHTWHIDPKHLFDRFYTADPARTNGATGIGLAVVHLLAEKLSATVQAEQNGDQLTITLRL